MQHAQKQYSATLQIQLLFFRPFVRLSTTRLDTNIIQRGMGAVGMDRTRGVKRRPSMRLFSQLLARDNKMKHENNRLTQVFPTRCCTRKDGIYRSQSAGPETKQPSVHQLVKNHMYG